MLHCWGIFFAPRVVSEYRSLRTRENHALVAQDNVACEFGLYGTVSPPPPYTDCVGVRVRQETHCTLLCTRWVTASFALLFFCTCNGRVDCIPACARCARICRRLMGRPSFGCDNKAFRVVVHALVCDGNIILGKNTKTNMKYCAFWAVVGLWRELLAHFGSKYEKKYCAFWAVVGFWRELLAHFRCDYDNGFTYPFCCALVGQLARVGHLY